MTEMAMMRREAGEFAAAVAHRMIEEIRKPEEQAAFAGALILPILVCRHRPPLPILIMLALMGDQLGRMAYRAASDLHAIAEASRGE